MPKPLSFTENVHCFACFRTAECVPRGVPGFWYLMALPIRFWNSWISCIPSARTGGRGSWVTSAPLSSMAPRRFISARCNASSLEVSSNSFPFVPTREIRQQVLDQALHAVGSVDGEGNELIGFGVEFAFVAPGKKLGVAGHHAQRLLQIVRGNVGKLPNSSFDPFSSSIFCRRSVSAAWRTLMSRIAAVTRIPSGLSSGLNMISMGNSLPSLRRPVSSIPVPICWASALPRFEAVGDDPFREALGNNVLHLLPDQFVAAVSELFFGLHIQ